MIEEQSLSLNNATILVPLVDNRQCIISKNVSF